MPPMRVEVTFPLEHVARGADVMELLKPDDGVRSAWAVACDLAAQTIPPGLLYKAQHEEHADVQEDGTLVLYVNLDDGRCLFQMTVPAGAWAWNAAALA